MRSLATLAILLLVCCLGACVDTPQKKLVGKWQVQGGDMTWEFHGNGTAATGTRKGKWLFADNKRLKIETGVATFMYEVEFPTRDTMVWRASGGARTELRRLE